MLNFALPFITFLTAMDLNNPPEEITNDLAETMSGKPFKRPAAEGLAEMRERLISLEAELLAHQDAGNSALAASTAAQIRDTKARLAEYQIQKEGLN